MLERISVRQISKISKKVDTSLGRPVCSHVEGSELEGEEGRGIWLCLLNGVRNQDLGVAREGGFTIERQIKRKGVHGKMMKVLWKEMWLVMW